MGTRGTSRFAPNKGLKHVASWLLLTLVRSSKTWGSVWMYLSVSRNGIYLNLGSSLLGSSTPFLYTFFKLDFLYELKQQLYWFSMPMWQINEVNGSSKLKFYFEILLKFYDVNNLVNSEQAVLHQVIKNFKPTDMTRIQTLDIFFVWIQISCNKEFYIHIHNEFNSRFFLFWIRKNIELVQGELIWKS